MTYEMMYSLRMALEYGLPEVNDVQIVYDGVDLTGIPKPFITVEYLQDVSEELSAGHASYYDTLSCQVGVFARDVNELYRLESKVRKVLREPTGHPLYSYNDVTGDFTDSGELIPFYDNGFTPIPNSDNSNQTQSHHGYFDVGVEYHN